MQEEGGVEVCEHEGGEGRSQDRRRSRGTRAEALVSMCGEGQEGLLVLADWCVW